ncbi:hypothetical protein QT327_21285 [Olivibacter sp. 47]|uniref:hypothetical protein n=1 Tax=Olivibacter sp. 47 TaxID=3056486 RepID=UPI0025A499F7|nr:hypothetical protein [Olivibacter sp. 47]MDM8176850.1 hypothetical protein [Olivibacter sp. 47]
MKQFIKSFLVPFLGFLLMIAPVVAAVTEQINISPQIAAVGVTVVLIALSVLGKKYSAPNVNVAGVTVEIWVKYIIERFWKNNAFMKNAFNDDQYVIGGKIVHIPQPGAKPVVRKNRTTFPAAAVRRTDTDILYALDEYSTDPTHIQDAEKVELSYDKIDSVLGDHIGAIADVAADDMILKWLADIQAANIIKTTGPATAATLVGATGNRKAAVHKDIRRARLLMNTNNVPQGDRFGLLEENMADQIFESLSDNEQRNFTEYADASTGVLGRLYSFDIMTRSSVAAATNTDAIKALDAEILATDNAVSMFWHKNAVARAQGEVKLFDNVNDPQYYGDIYSALVRMGGRRRRADDLGVVALIQDAVA